MKSGANSINVQSYQLDLESEEPHSSRVKNMHIASCHLKAVVPQKLSLYWMSGEKLVKKQFQRQRRTSPFLFAALWLVANFKG